MPDYELGYVRLMMLNQLMFTQFPVSNPRKNLTHLSNQNISDILSGKGASSEGLVTLGYNTSRQLNYFGERSRDLMYEIPHKTHLLNIAQNYIGRIVEVTPEEYRKMSDKDKQKTQMTIVGRYGTPDEAWCAHTVSYLCRLAGVNIGGHKKGVSQFIAWGQQNGRYKAIKTNTINETNFDKERKYRADQIKKQSKQMKEGDLIIWKSDGISYTQNGFVYSNASHIGIIECVNPDGTISVIEGNANEYKKHGKYERLIANNDAEAKRGNQTVGEAQEINSRDGIIRKVYTPEQLAADGYSGYIDMQGLVR